MITDIFDNSYGFEGKIYSEIFKTDMAVMIDRKICFDYVMQCVDEFNSLDSEVVETICSAAKAYCLEFLEETGGDFYGKMKISVTPETDPLEMLKCFKPTVLIVKKPEDEESICYQLECRTDWEIEHSMEIVIFNGNAVYLGVFGGHSPWREFSLDDKLNYINKI